MAVETVRINLLGSSFVIQTDESEQYINSLLSYYQSRLDLVSKDSRVDDPLKQSILATIYIVDELFRERVEHSLRKDLDADAHSELADIAQRLIARIDTTLRDAVEDPETTAAQPHDVRS
ncbi:MAG: cell division protein ZapA [Spirochaetes bacterium]|nr:cell division protein ZapA [Spirochaetota bacterium]MBU0956361.1 cell division protein ZapA [Spirochaetota bacterium]